MRGKFPGFPPYKYHPVAKSIVCIARLHRTSISSTYCGTVDRQFVVKLNFTVNGVYSAWISQAKLLKMPNSVAENAILPRKIVRPFSFVYVNLQYRPTVDSDYDPTMKCLKCVQSAGKTTIIRYIEGHRQHIRPIPRVRMLRGSELSSSCRI